MHETVIIHSMETSMQTHKRTVITLDEGDEIEVRRNGVSLTITSLDDEAQNGLHMITRDFTHVSGDGAVGHYLGNEIVTDPNFEAGFDEASIVIAR
jgi:hypothetical protein